MTSHEPTTGLPTSPTNDTGVSGPSADLADTQVATLLASSRQAAQTLVGNQEVLASFLADDAVPAWDAFVDSVTADLGVRRSHNGTGLSCSDPRAIYDDERFTETGFRRSGFATYFGESEETSYEIPYAFLDPSTRVQAERHLRATAQTAHDEQVAQAEEAERVQAERTRQARIENLRREAEALGIGLAE